MVAMEVMVTMEIMVLVILSMAEVAKLLKKKISRVTMKSKIVLFLIRSFPLECLLSKEVSHNS